MKKTMTVKTLMSCRVFVDGAGMRPDGTGSGYGWVNETTSEKYFKWVDGLTNNQAEYRGLLYALCSLPKGAKADISSDSELMVCQFNRRWKVRDPALQQLLDRVRSVIIRRNLRVNLTWVPRQQNRAGELLERAR
jgi:ribonuclease HI